MLNMFPYPSGDLHVGHGRNYILGDALYRYLRMHGKRALNPMGWDAFGLPAENAAIKRGIHPRDWTLGNIEAMKQQFGRWGILYDWSKEIASCDPEYYRWNQWLFLQLYKRGLAYQQKAPVNWCPSRSDRAGQRAGGRRPLRALRHAGRAARAGAVVLQHHRLRRPPRRRPRHAGALAGESEDDAAQLDRPLGGRRRRVPRARRSASRSASSPPAPTRSTAPPSWSWRRSIPRRRADRRSPAARGDRGVDRRRAQPDATWSGRRRGRKGASPASTRSIRRRARRSPSGSPTTCSPSTARAPSWPCRPTTRATSTSRSSTACRCGVVSTRWMGRGRACRSVRQGERRGRQLAASSTA